MRLRENSELIELVAPLLDEAIVSVAEQEFSRLRSAAINDAQVAENTTEAVKSLALMQYGKRAGVSTSGTRSSTLRPTNRAISTLCFRYWRD